MVGYYAGRKPHLLVTDPQATTEILVKNFTHFYDNEVSDMVSSTSDPILSRNPFFRKSDGWKTARKQLVPGLSTNRVKTFYPIIRSVCKRLTSYIELQCKKSSNVDIDDVSDEVQIDSLFLYCENGSMLCPKSFNHSIILIFILYFSTLRNQRKMRI